MKTIIFIIAVLCTSTFATQGKLALENQLQKLQKTGWGQIAAQFIELQLKLGGPIDELETAFRSLFADLQFQKQMEMKEWGLKTNDHNVLAASIADRQHQATTDIAQTHHSLDNILGPLKVQLETQLANDRALHDATVVSMNDAVSRRNGDNGAYEVAVEETEDAIAAILECIDLVSSLRNSPSFIQIQKTQNHIRKLEKHLSHKTEWGEMLKVMLEIAQNFSDQGNVNRVLEMLNDVLGEVHESLANLHKDEQDQVASHAAFMEISQTTLDQCNGRIAENEAALARCVADIAAGEQYLVTRNGDLDVANDDDAAEQARWASETEIHNTLISELEDQMQAVLEICEIVSAAPVSDDMKRRLNQ